MHDLLLAIDPMSISTLLSPQEWVSTLGVATFWLGVVLLFIECGLFFPFLPGDTLLFAMGLLVALGPDHKGLSVIPGPPVLDLIFVLVVYTLAAFAGNVVGYEIGSKVGPSIYHHDGKIIKRKYLDETSAFFDKHGNPALVIGRFVPIVRTYITFVAGVTRMDRRRFFEWSAIGAVLWVVSITLLGFILGKAWPGLGKYIDYITYGLLLVTLVGIGIEFLRKRNQPDPGVPAAYRAEYEAEHPGE